MCQQLVTPYLDNVNDKEKKPKKPKKTKDKDMAITWNVTITPINLVEKRVRILAVRTKTTDEVPPVILTVDSFQIQTIIDTPTQKIAAMDKIWELYQDKLNLDAQVAEVIGQLETQAKDNLEARE